MALKQSFISMIMLSAFMLSGCATQLVSIPGQESEPTTQTRSGPDQSAGERSSPFENVFGAQSAAEQQEKAKRKADQRASKQASQQAKRNNPSSQSPFSQMTGQSTATKQEPKADQRASRSASQSASKPKSRNPLERFGSQQTAKTTDTRNVESYTVKKVSNNMNFENRREELGDLAFWELEGRIGITVDAEAYNGSLTWQQEQEDLDFKFRGPLGFGGIRIHGTLGEQVRVKTTRGEEFFLTDIEKELEQQLGWQLPISSLRYWVLGITDPNFDTAVEVNEEGLLLSLEQEDWVVTYDKYMDVSGRQYPAKLKVVGPKTKIRLSIKEWTVNE